MGVPWYLGLWQSRSSAGHCGPKEKKFKIKRSKLVKRVNCILKLYWASTIDKFRVCFELDKHFTRHIDKWIDFAISKRLKRLELDFTPLMTMNQCYTFTHKRFTRIINSIGDFLTSLTLMCVNVTGKLLDHCLSNCPVLERLQFSISSETENLQSVTAVVVPTHNKLFTN